MVHKRRQFGDKGEKIAKEFLTKKGMIVCAENYRTPFGEIDLVAQKGGELIFIEVKTRRTTTFGRPEESVTPSKVQHILRSGEHYMQMHKWVDKPWRIDVVAILLLEGKDPEIVHYTHIDNPYGF
jgi:putative endonuclease